MEELQIQTVSDLPNNTLIFRFELQFGYNMEVQPNDPKKKTHAGVNAIVRPT